MNLFAFAMLAVTLVTVLSQKYEKFHVFTSSKFIRDFSPSERQFLFEIRTCTLADIAFSYNKIQIYWLIIKPPSLLVQIKKGPTNILLVEESVPLTTCNTFQKFKFMWNHHGNVSLWTTDSPGWRLLLTQEDPTPYPKGFDSLKLWSSSANWKIYKIEHSTEPMSSTCVNF